MGRVKGEIELLIERVRGRNRGASKKGVRRQERWGHTSLMALGRPAYREVGRRALGRL